MVDTGAPGPNAVRRGIGVNASERYLKILAEHTFLSLWSYLGVYRDQRWSGGRGGDGKELCDLLVVFGNHVVIFSDKDVAYNQGIDPIVAWRRWFKAAVKKSADQIYGAERWIKSHPDLLFLDHGCTQRFPIPLPAPDRMLVHRVIVAHGASEASRRALGGSGSLMIIPDLKGDDHVAQQEIELPSGVSVPAFVSHRLFSIGQINPQKGFVHVLDDATLDVLLRTLDTVTDLLMYLTRKERFITQGKLGFAAGEEDLLAYYLRDVGADGWNDFVLPEGTDKLMIDSGLWSSFQRHPQRLAQLEANRSSYAWDDLIERFNKHILNDTQFDTTAPGVASEPAVRFLAREPRTRRRFLVHQFVEQYKALGESNVWKACVIPPSFDGDPHYVFLVVRHLPDESYSEYRTRRRRLIEAYTQVVKAVRPQAQHIVGIATGAPGNENSEDVVYLDTSTWTSEDQRAVEELQRKTGLLTNLQMREGIIKTYPDVPSSST